MFYFSLIKHRMSFNIIVVKIFPEYLKTSAVNLKKRKKKRKSEIFLRVFFFFILKNKFGFLFEFLKMF